MTSPIDIEIVEMGLDAIAVAEGRVAAVVDDEGRLGRGGRRVNRLTSGALERLVASEAFSKLKPGEALEMAFPARMAADAVQVVKLPRRSGPAEARKAGAAMGKAMGGKPLLVLAGGARHPGELALGLALRAYAFDEFKTQEEDSPKPKGKAVLMVARPDEACAAASGARALAEGVFFARDLVSTPANVLTTSEFADRLKELRKIGLDVEVLEEPELEKLGMRTLLAVGQGSDSPSKVVVMRWKGGGGEKPFALVGKGVVFDSGGISLKPAQGMEAMTMDMGGAGVVAGTMKALALRGAKAEVVGLVGLVENMPDGRAQRPGDVVRTMKGDTVEVINTDAEGRLVLADVLWYAQERFEPSGIVDLATLTGAMVIALGHEMAGAFSNDDAFCEDFLKAARAEGEGAWRMPLGPAYDKMLKSEVADMKNVGGRPAGAITAAQFLRRFVRDGVPWIHLDIAGVASVKSEIGCAPKGATGWGVLTLNRLIADRCEI